MQFFKYTEITETTVFTNYIPTELWNFTLASHLAQKSKEEEVHEALILETSSIIDVLEDLMKEIKHDKTGKIITRRFENKLIKRPYQISLTNPTEIAPILKWLESNVIKIEQ